MKTIMLLLLSHLMFLANSFAWIIPEEIDHRKLLKDAEIAGLVMVSKRIETGNTKVLFKSGLKYREVQLTLKFLSKFKGNPPESIELSIYRIPTMEELKADGLGEDAFLKHLNESTSEYVHIYMASAAVNDVLLVYLKGDSKGNYLPCTGDMKPSHSIFVVETSCVIRSKNMLNNLLKERK